MKGGKSRNQGMPFLAKVLSSRLSEMLSFH